MSVTNDKTAFILRFMLGAVKALHVPEENPQKKKVPNEQYECKSGDKNAEKRRDGFSDLGSAMAS